DGAPVNLVESRHTPLSLPDGTTLPSGFRYATTLEDYRYLYKAYRSDARLQALHARFPMIAIWDDHEFSDDCWQDRQSYDADDDQTPQTARRRAANQ
ncbi:alkaline phosphatase D family protein, partial [Acinetobacter baumannii]|nr:alkaline phosphatase D family protein [Acinetobacter baumannii]